MRDLIFIAFLAGLLGMGFKRPFLFAMAYIYIDLVAPQRLTYLLLNSLPISLIAAGLAFLSWAFIEDKQNSRFSTRQGLLILLLIYAGLTTVTADFPIEAAAKWSWVWKALLFAIFLPLTLTTRLRIETTIFFIVISAASIVIVGGIKTLASGGGYGALNLMVSNNTGLYEGSIISTAGIAFIPLIWWLERHGTIFPREWRVTIFAVALSFAAMLLPVGTEARTGLLCIAVLAILVMRDMKRRGLYLFCVGMAGMAAIPFLPSSFTDRMETIKTYEADESASTRIAVWMWTWEYVKEHPFGGGFQVYLQNELRYDAKETSGEKGQQNVQSRVVTDKARAFHSSYFEMLGEQGFPGLFLWLSLQFGGLFRMEMIRRRYRKSNIQQEQWIAPLATALQNSHIVILTGSLFVGIAFQSFVLLILAVQMGFDTYVRRIRNESNWRPFTDTDGPPVATT